MRHASNNDLKENIRNEFKMLSESKLSGVQTFRSKHCYGSASLEVNILGGGNIDQVTVLEVNIFVKSKLLGNKIFYSSKFAVVQVMALLLLFMKAV